METALSDTILVCEDLLALSTAAAERFRKIAHASIDARGSCFAAVSGGSTPKRLFSLFAQEYKKTIMWQNVCIFWADERCVSKEDDESNYKHAVLLWLSKVGIPKRHIYRIEGEADPAVEARRYEESIKKAFHVQDIPVFDIVLLGMGSDGHTASLFPGSESLHERNRLILPVYSEQQKQNRITMTLPILNNARHIIFMVSGSSKARVLSEIIEHPDKRRRYPAGLIQPTHGDVQWLVDREATVHLTDKTVVNYEQL